MNGAIEHGAKVATSVIEGLKAQPLSLALVAINILFLIAAIYVVHGVSQRQQRQDAQLTRLIELCVNAKENKP